MKASPVGIVGAYESPRRAAPGIHPYQLHAESIRGALDQAGLDFADVDGFCVAAGDWAEGGAYSDILDLADYLDLTPGYFESTDVGGGSCISHAGHAVAAIRSGLASVVVLSYAGCPRWWPTEETFKDGLTYPGGPGQFEIPYSPTIVSQAAAQIARHMHLYGTTSEQLAKIAVGTRANAALNPQARYRSELTVDDVLESTVIASPLHKFDCCVVTDGGGAVVLTSAERALDCASRPLWITGFGESIGLLSTGASLENLADFMSRAADRAYETAGVGPDAIDVAQLYDAFTPTVMLQLEAVGLCGRGEGGQYVDAGGFEPGARVPINTDGGGLSSNHPGRRGIFLMIEAARQLWGIGPGFQAEHARTALVNGLGASAAMTMILQAE